MLGSPQTQIILAAVAAMASANAHSYQYQHVSTGVKPVVYTSGSSVVPTVYGYGNTGVYGHGTTHGVYGTPGYVYAPASTYGSSVYTTPYVYNTVPVVYGTQTKVAGHSGSNNKVTTGTTYGVTDTTKTGATNVHSVVSPVQYVVPSYATTGYTTPVQHQYGYQYVY